MRYELTWIIFSTLNHCIKGKNTTANLTSLHHKHEIKLICWNSHSRHPHFPGSLTAICYFPSPFLLPSSSKLKAQTHLQISYENVVIIKLHQYPYIIYQKINITSMASAQIKHSSSTLTSINNKREKTYLLKEFVSDIHTRHGTSSWIMQIPISSSIFNSYRVYQTQLTTQYGIHWRSDPTIHFRSESFGFGPKWNTFAF